MREILIIDNDVLIDIFYDLPERNIKHYDRTVEYLAVRFFEIWVPQEVEREFLSLVKEREKRKRRLKEIYLKYQFIKRCPITVSENEIKLDNNNRDEDRGETDAMLQSVKAMGNPDNRFKFSNVHLFFKDKRAIERASQKNLRILRYKDLVNTLREAGIVLP
jgi:hypothetical protein